MASLATDSQDDRNTRFHGCSSINQYEVLEKLGEGTFGEVHKAKSHKTGALVALKKILMHNEKDGFPITALREIKLLKMLSHGNVLQLVEMAIERPKVGKERKKAIMYMVTPYMDHDLLGLLANPDVQFFEAQIKCYMLQLLEGVRYLHDSHILHRDMKAANLLIDNKGCLRIADFGLARHYDEPVPRPGKGGGEARREYTALVVTRWYRPPELLLQLRTYTTAIDMWGVGCVFGEMFKQKPILTGSSDLNQIQIIFDLVGSPTEDNMPGWSSLPGCEGVTNFDHRPGNLPQVFREQGSSAISLLTDLLRLDWRRRITAIDALEHPYFRTAPLPARPGDLPTYEHSHELDRRKFATSKKLAAPPPAPAGGSVGMGANPNGEWGVAPGLNGISNSGPPSRDSRGAWGTDRPPRGHDTRPGPPPMHYDRDRPPRDPAFDQRRPAPYTAQPPLQRPAWQQQRNDGPPPPSSDAPSPSHDAQRSGGPKDTYIPPYSAANPTASQARPRDNQGVASRDDRDRGAYLRNERGPPASRDERQGPARGERGPPQQDGRNWERQPSRDEGQGYRARDYPPGSRDQRGPPPLEHGNDRNRDRAWNGGGGNGGAGRQGYGLPAGGDHRNRPRSRSPHNRDGYRR